MFSTFTYQVIKKYKLCSYVIIMCRGKRAVEIMSL